MSVDVHAWSGVSGDVNTWSVVSGDVNAWSGVTPQQMYWYRAMTVHTTPHHNRCIGTVL